MDETLTLHKETLDISEGRKLYNYTFTENGETLPAMTPEDIEAVPPTPEK